MLEKIPFLNPEDNEHSNKKVVHDIGHIKAIKKSKGPHPKHRL
jgi:hypothetical protein